MTPSASWLPRVRVATASMRRSPTFDTISLRSAVQPGSTRDCWKYQLPTRTRLRVRSSRRSRPTCRPMARRLTPMATTADSGHQTSTPGRAFRGTPRPSGSSWSTVHRSFRNARASLLQVRPPPVITVEIAAPGPARLIQVRPPPVLTVKIPALRPTRQGRPALGEGPGTPPQLIHAVQRPRLLRPIPSEVLRHVGQKPQEQDSNQETGQKKAASMNVTSSPSPRQRGSQPANDDPRTGFALEPQH